MMKRDNKTLKLAFFFMDFAFIDGILKANWLLDKKLDLKALTRNIMNINNIKKTS
ncbi:MAG: hypothetical protein ACTSVI_13975 [Promethearchaeota archaeon]